MTYTKTGPFNNGAAPGINATFLNNVENWLVTTSNVLNPPSNANTMKVSAYTTAKSGSPISHGTLTCYEMFAPGSSLLIVRLAFDQYQNSSSTAVDITLQAPFTQGGICFSGLIEGVQLLHGGTAVTLDFITGVSATGDGSTANGTKINAHSICATPPFSVLREAGGNAAQRSGTLTIIGF